MKTGWSVLSLVLLPAISTSPAAAQATGMAREAAAAKTFPASVQAYRDVVVAAEVSGPVVARPDDETRLVEAGEVVVTLDDTFVAAAHEAAKAAHDEALAQRDLNQKELERVERLRDDGSVGQAELDRAQAGARRGAAVVALMKARLIEAEARWKKTRVRAPFAGRLVRVHPALGAYLQPGKPVFRLIDDSKLKVIVYVRARFVSAFRVGDKLELGPPESLPRAPTAHPGAGSEREPGLTPVMATVHSIAPAAEGRARTFRIELRVNGAKGGWRPGMVCRIERPRPLPRPVRAAGGKPGGR